MNNVRIAILDDEQLHIDKMKHIINKCTSDRKIFIDEFLSKGPLLESEEEYDIILVDMELREENRNDEGMDFVRTYREMGKNAVIIFVTSHDELARDGYKVKALGFVYKGALEKELTDVLGEAFSELDDNKSVTFSVIKEKKVDIDESRKEVLIKDIEYFETEIRHIRVHLQNESFLVNDNINSMMEKLSDDRFCIIQKSYVVNMKYATGMTTKELTIKGKKRLPIGRARRGEVEKSYWKHKRERKISDD